MAKNKYKFGKSEIDLEQYINELGSNVDSYLESTGWGEEQKKQFRDAYNQYMEGFQAQNTSGGSRFYTNDFGDIYDTEGKLGSQDGNKVISFYYDNKGQRITPDEYNQLKDNKKKKYRAFSATSSFANYAKKVGKKLASSQSQESKEPDNKFSFAKHGFLPTWQRELLPAGGQWSTALFSDMDKANDAGVRGTEERANLLAQQLQNYSEKLGDYDYSDTPYGTKEEFKKRIQEAINSLQNGYDASDTRALSRIGIGEDFLSGYFQTGQTKEPLTGIEGEIENLKKEKEEAEKQKQLEEEKYNLTRDQYFRDYNPQLENPYSGNFGTSYFDSDEKKREANAKNLLSAFINTRGLSNLEVDDQIAALQQQFSNKDFKDISDIIRGKRNPKGDKKDEHIRNMLSAAALFDFFSDNKLTENGKPTGWYAIPNSQDLDRGSFLAYNPSNGQIEERAFNLGDELQKRMAYEAYDSVNRTQKKEEGGIIYYQFGGKYVQAYKDSKKSKQETKQGEKKEDKSANDRKPGETGFTAMDITRLASIGLDVGSLAAATFVPGAGTIASAGLGVGSSVGNLIADIGEDGFQWSDLGNFGTNLAMDAVGLIPGAGSAGKMGKITQKLIKYVPRIITVLSARNLLTPEHQQSWSKITSKESLSVDDWKNIANDIKAVVGIGRMVHSNVKSSAMRQATKTGNVKIEDETGNMLAVTPETLQKIKNAKTLAEANEALQKEHPDKKLASLFSWKAWDNPRIAEDLDFSRANHQNDLDFRVWKSVQESNFGSLRNLVRNPYASRYIRPQEPVRQTTQQVTQSKPTTSEIQRRNAIDQAIENNPNFMWRKEGGILKFQDGGYWRTGYLTNKGTLENAKLPETWRDYYDFDKILKEVPTKVTQDANKFIISMNNLSKIKQDNNLGFGLSLNERGYADWNREFNNTGFNHFFQYNEGLNDYLDPSTYNRKQLIDKLQGIYNSAEKALKINGQNVYYDGSQWALAQPATPGEVKPEEEQKPGEPEETSEVKPRVAVSGEDAVAKEAKQATSRGNGLSSLGALRLWLGNRANKRMTKLALDAQQPMYLNPVQSHRYVQSDLSAEMAGQDAMARLMNWSSKPMTSDISQNFAQQMDAMVKGLDYVNQGRRQSNATLREMAEKAWLQEQQNALSRNQIHNQNLASAYQTMQNKSAIQQAFENKQFTNWDTFLKQMEYDKLVANREKKAREDAMAQKQFSRDVTDNLAAYDPKLPREAVQLYQDVQMGIKNVSSLTPEEIQLLRQATASANEAMDKLYSQRYGLARQYLSAKKGGKLDPNKDLDRFYKYLDSVMNRNEKALDRVSKSMYALYKRKSK